MRSSQARANSQIPPTNSLQEYPTLPSQSVIRSPAQSGPEASPINSQQDSSTPPTPTAPKVTESLTDTGSEAPHTNSLPDFQTLPTTGDNTLMVGGGQKSTVTTQQEVLSMKHTMTQMMAQLNRVISQMGMTSQ